MKLKQLFFISLVLLFSISTVVSCSDDNPTEPNDTEPPYIGTIYIPEAGSIVSEIVTLETYATDNVGVTQVVFEVMRNDVGYEEVGIDTTPDADNHFSVEFHSSLFDNGEHGIHATAYDAAGNSELAGWQIIFDNGTVEPGGMILVQGGTFEMGDRIGNGYSIETPLHDVTVSSFYMGQYEVTQVEYEAVMGKNPAHNYGVGDNYPVYYVSWYDAVEYCNALSVQEGLTPCYNTSNWSCDFSANGYRLPTEAEWEYAARGGVNQGDNHEYSGTTNNLGDYAVYSANDPGGTAEVGTKLPNQLEIYDMSGNVWEWCNDWHSSSYYSSSPANNPTGPDSATFRVNRGGSWYFNADHCRVAYRFGDVPSGSFFDVGFRILRACE